MKSLNIRKGALLSAVAAMVITTVFAVPAKAAADDLITPNNGTCEFAAASLGHGSQSDPFLIGTSKQLAEISDCSKRQATITGAVGNGTSVTFTADNTFGVGQAIEIAAVSPGGFNRASARVTAATSTSFTIASTVTDTYSDSGVATDNSTFYSLTADIDLSTGNDAWNNVDSAVITNATGDGSTITYTAANTFEAGQEIVVKNVNPIEYSVGAVTVVSATATEFTVSGSATSAYVSGGEANSLGWLPISNGRNFTFIGNGHTISGLTSHRPQNRLALFDQVTAATFLDFNMTDVEVDVTGPSNYNYTAGLTGSSTSSIYRNLNIAGTVIGSTNHIGLVSGEARGSIMSDIEVSGMILSGRTTSFSSGQNAPQRMGGLAGYQYGTIEDSRSSVNVYGYMTNNVEDARSYGRNIGSLVGTQDGNIVNSYATGEVHGGNQTGGLTGYQCCGDVANSYATGNVFGYANVNTNVDYIGGFIGDYGCCGAIRDSYSTGDVTVVNSGTTGAGYIGGFLGSNDCCSLVLNSYSTGDVNVTASLTNAAYQVGGFIGHHDCCNNIVGSHSTGDVTVNNGHQIGGFIGLMEAETAIYDSYSTGDVTVSYDGEAEVGGFIGEVLDDINLIRSYATGNVTVTPITDGQSTKFVGGLIGVTDNGPVQIVDSYYVGSVTASDFVGGLIGWNNAGAVIVKNTYVSAAVTATDTNANVDAIANGFLTSFDGSNVYNSTVSVTALNSANFVGKTTAELQNKATFTGLGWNFDADNGVWTIASDVNGGLPTLVAPKAANNGGGTTPEVVEKSVSLSSKNGVLSLSAATKFKVRTYTVNLPNTFAKKQVKVNVVRAGKVVKVLKVAKLNKGGNITFNSKYTLKKGDLVQVRDAKKVRATVTIS